MIAWASTRMGVSQGMAGSYGRRGWWKMSEHRLFVSVIKGRLTCHKTDEEMRQDYCMTKCNWNRGRSPGGGGILCAFRTEEDKKDDARRELVDEGICPDCLVPLVDDRIKEGRYKGHGAIYCPECRKVHVRI